jgi:glutamine amidotransferase
MCELLGVSASPGRELGVYFERFRTRAEENRDGWGFAWWEDGAPHTIKEPVRIDESDEATRLEQNPPRSEVFIVHVRAASVGSLIRENAHPFAANAVARDWVFAHNGTVQELDRLETGGLEPEGETDSERAFHHLLARLDALGATADDDVIAACVLAAGRELSERDSRVNFLLSDGQTLYAYHDGHRTLHVLDHGTAAEGVVIASVPLTDEPGWIKLSAGEVLVVRDGTISDRVSPSYS